LFNPESGLSKVKTYFTFTFRLLKYEDRSQFLMKSPEYLFSGVNDSEVDQGNHVLQIHNFGSNILEFIRHDNFTLPFRVPGRYACTVHILINQVFDYLNQLLQVLPTQVRVRTRPFSA
jgi:hypothetical protein